MLTRSRRVFRMKASETTRTLHGTEPFVRGDSHGTLMPYVGTLRSTGEISCCTQRAEHTNRKWVANIVSVVRPDFSPRTSPGLASRRRIASSHFAKALGCEGKWPKDRFRGFILSVSTLSGHSHRDKLLKGKKGKGPCLLPHHHHHHHGCDVLTRSVPHICRLPMRLSFYRSAPHGACAYLGLISPFAGTNNSRFAPDERLFGETIPKGIWWGYTGIWR